jgi:UDP-N-acetylglucosamine 2-epimerase (non-hydrolysing)
MRPNVKKVLSVVGARPNFMKVAPLEREFLKIRDLTHAVVHTGQHYGKEMSGVFFDQLGLPQPVRNLGVGSGDHGEMTGRIMIAFEKVCKELRPDLVVVVGDVNSTIAAALVARKMSIPVAHVEAGLRSFDETMPEELNRRLTDNLSNLLFASEPSAVENLKREGIDPGRVHLVGDVMVETLQLFLPQVVSRRREERLGLLRGQYGLVTIHRPANVDSPEALGEMVGILKLLPLPLLFPVHPRTVGRLQEFGLMGEIEAIPNLRLTAPETYLDFLSLLEGARLVLTDSGSIQSEAAFFNVPCLVCRENTERPFYIEHGTSVLVGRDQEKVSAALEQILNNKFKSSDSQMRAISSEVAGKIVRTIADYLSSDGQTS